MALYVVLGILNLGIGSVVVDKAGEVDESGRSMHDRLTRGLALVGQRGGSPMI